MKVYFESIEHRPIDGHIAVFATLCDVETDMPLIFDTLERCLLVAAERNWTIVRKSE